MSADSIEESAIILQIYKHWILFQIAQNVYNVILNSSKAVDLDTKLNLTGNLFSQTAWENRPKPVGISNKIIQLIMKIHRTRPKAGTNTFQTKFLIFNQVSFIGINKQ